MKDLQCVGVVASKYPSPVEPNNLDDVFNFTEMRPWHSVRIFLESYYRDGVLQPAKIAGTLYDQGQIHDWDHRYRGSNGGVNGINHFYYKYSTIKNAKEYVHFSFYGATFKQFMNTINNTFIGTVVIVFRDNRNAVKRTFRILSGVSNESITLNFGVNR